MPEIFVAHTAQFAEADRRILTTARGEIGVFRHKGAFYAYANNCVHSGGPACEGVMMPRVVDIIDADGAYQGQTFDEGDMHFVCPWHGYEYEVTTGVCVGDRKLKLKSYEVVQRGDDVFVVV